MYAIGVIMKKAGFTFEARLLQSYVTLLETRCPSLLSSYCQDFNDVLWKATEDESFNFVKMMVSPREIIKFLYDTRKLTPITVQASGRISLDVQHGDRLVSDGRNVSEYLIYKIIILNLFAENFQN
jgi:hypothetical protein